ncbi:hypothetical protein Gbth_025_040 [Gluconobacter thailandicus F149-1 = NBRC 100600]|uniref:DUF2501 domain-containing protein n=1 Tax=Gluconobacter thailandicus NBRC 3257 TaxID=1381097 RepID=A0ABQ0IUV2_GLUTH|nr:hypothetical protein [Gluconobacter thailandicus]GAN91467.1 hypothetical protein Gbfr_037_062 [Gluconobacter frateurii M-2]KXV52181.1 hypothetical protein AD946_14720 [Gluconobacter thailandicus]GAC86426.1 hypothetical protein NBRC3255_0087 [Gluconobacter thailandicus NBRC 3255]GAD25988.1 hypothetical protein NBRC3257_0987 [Gluconobacter thailandicus NBRC 3257]GAN93575.1 hypothetical protein Gbth_025_040 [Gluconobacter thailandicus F149-1 = NBRC 100600]
MNTNKYFAAFAALGLAFSGAAVAQTAPQPGQPIVPPGTQAVITPNHVQAVGGLNGIATAATPGTLGDNGMPSIDNAQAGNVAGLTSYCIHKKLSLGTGPRSASRNLAKRADVQNDQYYSLGGRGLLQTSSNTPFDISTLPKDKQVLVCRDLFKKAQSLGN